MLHLQRLRLSPIVYTEQLLMDNHYSIRKSYSEAQVDFFSLIAFSKLRKATKLQGTALNQ